jgi:NAD+ diphosphatase
MAKDPVASEQPSSSPARFVPGIVAPEACLNAYWLLYQGDNLIVADGEPMAALAGDDPARFGLSPLRIQYLGCVYQGSQATHCFAGEVELEAVLPTGLAAVDLRRMFDVFDDLLFGVAGRAKQIAQWDRDHQFCGRCAAATVTAPGERAKRCPQCGLTSYPRLSPAIIIAITRTDPDCERILLARNHRFPAGRYSIVAGFVEPGESLEECAIREVREEVGVEIANIRYYGSQPWPFPSSLMIGFTAEYAGGEIDLDGSEIADAGWFTADNLPHLPPKASIARKLIDAFALRSQSAPDTTLADIDHHTAVFAAAGDALRGD